MGPTIELYTFWNTMLRRVQYSICEEYKIQCKKRYTGFLSCKNYNLYGEACGCMLILYKQYIEK